LIRSRRAHSIDEFDRNGLPPAMDSIAMDFTRQWFR